MPAASARLHPKECSIQSAIPRGCGSRDRLVIASDFCYSPHKTFVPDFLTGAAVHVTDSDQLRGFNELRFGSACHPMALFLPKVRSCAWRI